MKTTVLPLRAVVLLLILTLVWGTSWPLFPFAMRQISVWTFRAVTLSAGGLLVLALARLGGHPLTIPRQDRRSLIFSAIIYLSVWNICSGYSAITIPSGQTAVLGFTMPLWSALISWAILGETLPRRLILALVFGGSAVMCLMVSGLAAYAHAPAGFAAGLLGGVGWAIGTLIFKRRRINAHALVVTGWQLLIASVPISAAALVLGNHVWFVPTWQSLAVVSYLTLFPICIGNICWFSLIEIVPANVAGLSSVLIPVVAMLSGAYVHGEPLGPLQGLAMLACMMALWLALPAPAREMSTEAGEAPVSPALIPNPSLTQPADG